MTDEISDNPIVEHVRVDIQDDLYVCYWYNFSRQVYQYFRSEEPFHIQTDLKCPLNLSYEELKAYIQSKHSE